MKLTIIIPSFNPPESLPQLCRQLSQETGASILVVNDGSPATYQSVFQAVSDQGVEVIHLPQNMGKGEAIRSGLKHALDKYPDATHFTFCDDDGQHAIPDVKQVSKNAMTDQHRFVIGTRSFDQYTPWKSLVGNRFMAWWAQLIHGISISDTQSGLRSCSRDIAETLITIKGERFSYEMRTLIELKKRGIRIDAEPIRTLYMDNNKQSRFRPLADSWQVVMATLSPNQPAGLQRDRWFFLFLFLVLFCAYFPSMTGDFIGDDVGRIEFNLKNYGFNRIMEELGDRPLLSLSLWFQYIVLKMPPGAMRVISLLLLSLIGLLLKKIIQRIYKNEAGYTQNDSFVILLVLAFCLHPLHTQTVIHVVQQGILLSTLGWLFATYLILVKPEELTRPNRLQALLSWLMAILAKPNVMLMPLGWVYALKRLNHRNVLRILWPFLILSLLPVLLYKFVGYNQQNPGGGSTFWDYFLTQGTVLFTYAKLALIPYGLKFNHDVVAFPNTHWWPGLGLWALIIVAFAIAFIKSRRITAIFLIFLVLSILPESSFFPIMHAMFEHRTFLPMTIGTIVLATLVQQPRKLITYFLICLIPIYGTLTFRRALEVQRFPAWVEKEISWTCSYRWMAAHWLDILMQKEKYDEAQAALNAMPECTGHLKLIFSTLLEMERYPDTIEANLKKLTIYLNSEMPIDMPERQLVNEKVAKIVMIHAPRKKLACALEEYASQQLKKLSTIRRENPRFFIAYHKLARQCLDEIGNTSSFQSLKIRTILYYYYGLYDPNLAADLSRSPNNEQYGRLHEMFREKEVQLRKE